MKQFTERSKPAEVELLSEVAGDYLIGYTTEGGRVTEFRLRDDAPDDAVEQVEQALGRDFGSGRYAPREETAIQEAIRDEPADSPVRLLADALLGATAKDIEAARKG